MGNSAIVKAYNDNQKAVYLHWQGGKDSIQAFLKYCELKGYRGFDDDYGFARFVQVVGNFLGGRLSLGVISHTESYGDNGVYIIKDWDIVGRENYNGIEQDFYKMDDMLKMIDESQPIKEQLGDFLNARKTLISDIKIGDTIFVQNREGYYHKKDIVGFGVDKIVNGTNVKGIPYIKAYGLNNYDYTNNINNYIIDEQVYMLDKSK